MRCREAIFVDKSAIGFPIFLLFFNTKFPIFPFSQSWVSYFPFFLSNHAAGHPEKFLRLQKQPQLISLGGRRSKGKEREFQAREKHEGHARKQATTSLKHSFLRGHNTTTCSVFFLIFFNAKSVWEENFQVLLERILSGKNGLPKIYKGEKEHLGSRDLEELPKSIYIVCCGFSLL